MAVSPRFDSTISGPPRHRKSFPRLAKTASSLWYLARLAAIAGLLASGSAVPGVGATTGKAVAAQSASLAGQLLVAKPELRDPRFSRTVVYIVHHDTGGAMGLILNRPIGDASLSELLEQAGVEGKSVNGQIRVHFGGPVEPARGFVLHTADYKIEDTQVVKDGIAVTARDSPRHWHRDRPAQEFLRAGLCRLGLRPDRGRNQGRVLGDRAGRQSARVR